MTDKLMYIWNNKDLPDDRRRAQRRVAIVRDLGFQVVVVSNRHYVEEEGLLDWEAEARECAGIWVDVPSLDIGLHTQRLIAAAEEVGRKILGHVDEDEQIAGSIANVFGRPDGAEAIT